MWNGNVRCPPPFWLHLQGSAADSAGIHQGDELLAVDGASLSSATPYQVLLAVTSLLFICVQVLPSSVPMRSNVATLRPWMPPAGVRDVGRQPWSGRRPAAAAAHARCEGRRREGTGPQRRAGRQVAWTLPSICRALRQACCSSGQGRLVRKEI
jgi:hypothetical protein